MKQYFVCDSVIRTEYQNRENTRINFYVLFSRFLYKTSKSRKILELIFLYCFLGFDTEFQNRENKRINISVMFSRF